MNEDDIQQHANQALDESSRTLSPEIRQHLYEARQRALSHPPQPWFKRPLGGFAVAASFSALLLLNYIPTQQSNPMPDLAKTSLEDFILLSSFDESDMEIAEELEFAYWLTEQLDNESTPEYLPNSELRNG